MITETGIVPDVPEHLYHADTTSLSASGAKVILKNPARYRWELDNPPAPRDVLDIGTAAHTLILGTGAPLAAVPDETLATNGAASTKAAKEFIAEARAAGKVPLKASVVAQIHAIRDAVRADRLANAMLSDGKPEQSMWWTDPATGVRCRSRIDWLRNDGRVIDLKTCADATEPALIKAVPDFGYDLSREFYRDGLEALTGERPSFSFVFVEKEPPHRVRVVLNLSDWHERRGRDQAAEAREAYADYEANGWPDGYDPIDILPAPRWAS